MYKTFEIFIISRVFLPNDFSRRDQVKNIVIARIAVKIRKVQL